MEEQEMTLAESVNILMRHNSWRRGEGETDDSMPEVPSYTPTELGIALDEVVAFMLIMDHFYGVERMQKSLLNIIASVDR